MESLQESQNLVQEPNEENVIEGIDSEEIEETNEVGETQAGKEKDTDKEKVDDESCTTAVCEEKTVPDDIPV